MYYIFFHLFVSFIYTVLVFLNKIDLVGPKIWVGRWRTTKQFFFFLPNSDQPLWENSLFFFWQNITEIRFTRNKGYGWFFYYLYSYVRLLVLVRIFEWAIPISWHVLCWALRLQCTEFIRLMCGNCHLFCRMVRPPPKKKWFVCPNPTDP